MRNFITVQITFVALLFASMAEAGVYWKKFHSSDGWCRDTCALNDLHSVGTGAIGGTHGGSTYRVCATLVGPSGQFGHYRTGYSLPWVKCSTEFGSSGTQGSGIYCLCDDKTSGDYKWITALSNQSYCSTVCATNGGSYKKPVISDQHHGKKRVCLCGVGS